MISAIVCVDENWGIGYQGKLLAHIPEDMKFFKDKTTNNAVIMGRKTYDSLPLKPLPNRTNIVITSKKNKTHDNDATSYVSMKFIKTYFDTLSQKSMANYYIIGGGQIYKELLPYCDKVYVTKVFHCYDNADTYFPNIDNIPEWEIESASEIKEYNNIKYQFCTYKKGDTSGQN